MEVAGFALGVVGVTGTFQACVKCYGDILSLRVCDEDDALERDPSSVSQGSRLWNDLLSWMRSDITRLSEQLARHASPAPAYASRNSALASRSRRVKRLAHGVAWVPHDKARLSDLVGRIRHWNEGLADLLPEVKRQRASFETVAGATLRGMTLRSRGSLRSSGKRSLMDVPQWKRPADSFEWWPCDTTPTRPDLAEAASLERAFATGIPIPSRQNDIKEGSGIAPPTLAHIAHKSDNLDQCISMQVGMYATFGG
ncbi:hypothetical protein B0T18DRAFT_431067 [Schizothecium vesticola]|uniref:Prion-inhibition and propagation HeLo domain-containing protein n=1 Tax=Schizothecium vesticola TaxID=314040 RepID=A0AA40EQX7_9PEZI|nr:hypothetical protein B0T18DRAFT_431067 [Schizothecium vesticola]